MASRGPTGAAQRPTSEARPATPRTLLGDVVNHPDFRRSPASYEANDRRNFFKRGIVSGGKGARDEIRAARDNLVTYGASATATSTPFVRTAMHANRSNDSAQRAVMAQEVSRRRGLNPGISGLAKGLQRKRDDELEKDVIRLATSTTQDTMVASGVGAIPSLAAGGVGLVTQGMHKIYKNATGSGVSSRKAYRRAETDQERRAALPAMLEHTPDMARDLVQLVDESPMRPQHQLPSRMRGDGGPNRPITPLPERAARLRQHMPEALLEAGRTRPSALRAYPHPMTTEARKRGGSGR